MANLHRRQLMSGIAAMIGAGVVAPVARAMAAETAPQPGFGVVHPFLTPAQRKLVAAASERIIPTTDTPGAIAAGVPDFIEMMLGDWYDTTERDLVLGGLAAIDAFSSKMYAKPFAAVTPARQDAILTLAMNKTLPGLAGDPFEHLRQLVILGYYTSEIGCTVERVYLPVPGHYDGAYPYAKVGRVFSS